MTLLSDPMEGGDLQVVRRSRDEALHRIAETRNQLEEPEIVTVAPREQGVSVSVLRSCGEVQFPCCTRNIVFQIFRFHSRPSGRCGIVFRVL